jgi:hypothetical protein
MMMQLVKRLWKNVPKDKLILPNAHFMLQAALTYNNLTYAKYDPQNQIGCAEAPLETC